MKKIKIWKKRCESYKLKSPNEGFPGGPVVKNSPYNAGDMGSISGEGIKIPSAVGQLSLHATTREPMRPDTAK